MALSDGIKRTEAKIFRRKPPEAAGSRRQSPAVAEAGRCAQARADHFVVVIAPIAMRAILILADIVNPFSLF